MFYLDIFGNPQPLHIYLSRPDGSLITNIDDMIDQESASLEIGLNKQYTLSFDMTKTANNTWFDHILEGMYLFVEKIGLFKMDQPQIEMDGQTEKKTITAHSVDSEFEDKEAHYEINMGTKTSLERHISYQDGEQEVLINPYTDIPYDWILLYNTLPEQLNEFKNKVATGYFGNKNGSNEIEVTNTKLIDELTDMFELVQRLKSKIVFSDNQDGSQDSALVEYVITNRDQNDNEHITKYILKSQFSSRIDELITYYTKYRDQLSLLDIICKETNYSWNVGDIYGVTDGDYTLANKKWQFDINETLYSFLTQTLSQVGKCIVNFDNMSRKINVTPVEKIGSDTGITIGYDNLVNTLNIDTEDDRLTTRIFVSGGNNLNIRKVNFGSDYVPDITYKVNAKDANGKRIYVSDEFAEKYVSYISDLEQNRQRFIELSALYDEYEQQIDDIKTRVPLDSLKVDYSTFSMEELQGELTVYKNLLATLESLYKEEFTPDGLNNDGSIKESYIENTVYWYDYQGYQSTIKEIEFAIRVFPDYNDHTQWSSNDLDYYTNTVNAWETDWSLYGTIELQSKIEAYKNNMNSLAQKGVIKVSEDSYVIKTWNQLTDTEKSEYMHNDGNYHYDTYMENYNNMIAAQSYLDTLNAQISSIEELADAVIEERDAITVDVQIENNFTESECKVINRLYRDSNYSNENILSTKIDSPTERIDRANELLNDAKDQISIMSRPQLQFTVDADNLLAIKEFEPLWSQFVPGNYIYVQYKDDTYVKLRLIGYTFNPTLPSSSTLSIEFSNFVRSRSYYHDWASLLGTSSMTGGSSSGGSSGGGSGDGYGESDDIDVTISNTMLAKLLKSETFGTRVTDIILDTVDANVITARNATFGGLANGTTNIDGKCVVTGWIISQNYNGNRNVGDTDNTVGSILNIEDGTFSFLGGKLKGVVDKTVTPNTYSLTVDGRIIANTGEIGGFTIDSTSIHTKNLDVGSNADNSIALSSTDFTRSIKNASGTDTQRTGLRFAIGDKFGVTGDGVIYANSAILSGTLTAGSGSQIGPWVVSNTYIRNGEVANSGDTTVAGVYLGTDGLNISGGTAAKTAYIKLTTSGNTKNLSVNIGNKLTWDGATLSVDGSGTFSGTITANNGNIGGWVIEQNWLYNGTNHPAQNSVFLMPAGTQSAYPVAGHTINGWVFTSHDTFGVTKSGGVYATAGEIGGWTITSSQIYKSVTISGTEYRPILNAPSSGIDTNKFAFTVATKGANDNDWSYPFSVSYGGALTSTSGSIGGWTINAHSLTASANNVSTGNVLRYTGLQVQKAGTIYAIAVGATSNADWSTAPFRVKHTGELYATGADISGVINATSGTFAGSLSGATGSFDSGTIGGWTLTANALSASATIDDTTRITGLQVPSSGSIAITVGATTNSSWATGPFYVTHKGVLHASGATISGEITANTGKIGGTNGWSISNGSLSIGTLGQNGSMFLSTLGNYAYVGDDYVTGLGLSIGSNFGVSLNGDLYAKSGKIGDWSINNGILDATTTDGSISLIPSQGIYFTSQISGQHATSYQISHGSGFLMDDLTASHRTWIKSGICSVSSDAYTGNVINVDAQVSSPCVTIQTTRLVDTYASVQNSGAWGRLLASTGSRFGLYNMTSGYAGWLIYCDSTGKVTCNDGTTLSDIRMKDNIKDTDINNARQIVDKFKIRQFDWKTDGEHQDIGFIADELEQIDTHLAFGGGVDEFGNINTKHIDTLYLLSYLTKAFQELSEEVKQLRAENNQLKNKIL